MGLINLGEFVFNYARFHNDKTNKILHLIFIPMILLTGLVLLRYALVVPIWWDGSVVWNVDLGQGVLVMISVTYVLVDLPCGVVTVAFLIGNFFLAKYTLE